MKMKILNGNSIKKEILYQKVVLPVDGVDQVVKRRIHPQIFGFYKKEEGKIEKYPAKYEFIEELSEHGNIHQINRQIELEFFEYYKKNDIEIENENEIEIESKMIVEKRKVLFEKVHVTIDDKDEIIHKRKRTTEFEYFEVYNDECQPEVQKYQVKYFIEDHPKSELKIIDSKTGKIESENDDDDNEMIIHVHIKQEPNDFEFIEVEDIENNEKKIVSQKIEYTTIPFENDGHIQDLHLAFHPDKFEYDEIIDENDNRKLIKRKVEFVVVKLEDGRIVHKQNDSIEDEIIEFEDTNGDKKTLKRKAQY